ncbi:formyltransferase family protein [Gammaproteobacteria bacterium]|nr:formyltransferase family protein [Gammaproteobacteria bacterium]
MKVGIITYDNQHLKTEEITLALCRDNRVDAITLFAIPYNARRAREVKFAHRPQQESGTHSRHLNHLNKVSYQPWDGQSAIVDDSIDYFVITGAGILDISFANGKSVFNAHPGIIPTSRGLDSFKWAIHDGHPLGVTLHVIDNTVDSGELVAIEPTPTFSDDTLETLAMRHYRNEITLMGNIAGLYDQRISSTAPPGPARMRMPIDIETTMIERFPSYCAKFAIDR